MKFQIAFNDPNYYNDRFLIEILCAELVPTGSDKYPPFEMVQIDISGFEHLKLILETVYKEFNCISTALISFDPPTIFLEIDSICQTLQNV